MAGRGQSTPASVAEGLADVIRDMASTLTAPDAQTHASLLTPAFMQLMDLYHKVTGNQAPPGMGAPGMGAPGPPGLGAASPGRMAGPANLAALMGQAGGPSTAASPGSSPSGTTAERLRQMVAMSAASQGGT